MSSQNLAKLVLNIKIPNMFKRNIYNEMHDKMKNILIIESKEPQ